jgi:MarR family 2-MHQ and catechol resistance regulon transcriptional repressor
MRTTQKYKKKALAPGKWVKLARAAATFGKRAEENIKTFGLTHPQFSALECVGHIGPMIVGELCRGMLVSAGHLTVVLDNLEKPRLIQRVGRI